MELREATIAACEHTELDVAEPYTGVAQLRPVKAAMLALLRSATLRDRTDVSFTFQRASWSPDMRAVGVDAVKVNIKLPAWVNRHEAETIRDLIRGVLHRHSWVTAPVGDNRFVVVGSGAVDWWTTARNARLAGYEQSEREQLQQDRDMVKLCALFDEAGLGATVGGITGGDVARVLQLVELLTRRANNTARLLDPPADDAVCTIDDVDLDALTTGLLEAAYSANNTGNHRLASKLMWSFYEIAQYKHSACAAP